MLSIQEHRTTDFTVSRATHASVNNNLTAIGFATGEKFYVLADPVTLYVKSTSANDTRGGTGARTIIIKGAIRIDDSNTTLITETLEMSGTAYVATAYQYSEIYSVVCETHGSLGTNNGDISINYLLEGVYTTLYLITSSQGVKKNSLFTAPTDMKMKQLNVFINSVDGDKIDFTSVFYEIQIKKLSSLKTGEYSTQDYDPEASTTPGILVAKYLCSGGKTELQLYDTLKPSDIVWCTAQNVTNTDSYRISTELVLYRI